MKASERGRVFNYSKPVNLEFVNVWRLVFCTVHPTNHSDVLQVLLVHVHPCRQHLLMVTIQLFMFHGLLSVVYNSQTLTMSTSCNETHTELCNTY